MVELICDLTSLKIEHIPNSPASLCSECKTCLEQFESFRAMCLANDKIFRDTYILNDKQEKTVEILTVTETGEQQTEEQEYLYTTIDEIQDEELQDNQGTLVVEIDKLDELNSETDEYEIYYSNPSKEIQLKTNQSSSEEEHPTQLESTPRNTNGRKLCMICNKYVNRLAQHQLIHKEIRPFQCEFCSKGFNQMSNLKKHIRLHTKEKPYLCNQCDKGFTNSTELKIHVRSHTQERPFTCEECGKSFVTSGHLARHSRSHSGLKPYGCDVCSAKFSTSSHLVRHKRIHSKELPYRCATCDGRFMRTEYLRAHKCNPAGT
ncbi:AAEL004512-PA [Aedes aegypti]|nr:AAEL004512-PA [Aedes aegypti]